MDAQLKSQLKQTVYVSTLSSVDSYGDLTFAAPASKLARVTERRKSVKLSSGEERMTTHRIWIEDAVTMTDRLWLPGVDQTDSTLARRPLSVSKLVDELGVLSHYAVDV